MAVHRQLLNPKIAAVVAVLKSLPLDAPTSLIEQLADRLIILRAEERVHLVPVARLGAKCP